MSELNNNNNKNNRGGLSSGEVFVAVNLLSKIGALFVIASVIAFSAASEGYLPDGVRMALVPLVGLIMLAAGELFYRKDSRAFANALIYGGVTELFICVPIGTYGLEVFESVGALVMGFVAAAVGYLLALRYKSQGLVIVTIAGAVIPIFCLDSVKPFLWLTVYLILVDCVAAVISRKNFYTGAVFTGIAFSMFKTLIVWVFSLFSMEHLDNNTVPALFAMIFTLCCGICWSGGALLNACEVDGEMEAGDIIAFLMSQGITVFYTMLILWTSVNVRTAGTAMAVLALLYALAAVGFSLKYWTRCMAVSALLNLIFTTAVLALLMLINASNWRYIVLHIFAAAVFIASVYTKRRLFRNWGFALLTMAEMAFFWAMAEVSVRGPGSDKLLVVFINLILWFGILAVTIMKEKRGSTPIRLYTLASFINAGILFNNLIGTDLMRLVRESFGAGYERSAFSAMLCAMVWLVLGFVMGRLGYMEDWKLPCSWSLYGVGLIQLLWANSLNYFGGLTVNKAGGIAVFAAIIVNIVSVMAVLDVTLRIGEKKSGFGKAIGLVVSGYSLLTLTTLLGTNGFVKFTSCIISIIYILMSAAWIGIGFWKNNALLRRFGLALALFSSAKLFLFDFTGVDAMGRTLLFIGFGVTLLGISFGYAVAEKKLSQRNNK